MCFTLVMMLYRKMIAYKGKGSEAPEYLISYFYFEYGKDGRMD